MGTGKNVMILNGQLKATGGRRVSSTFTQTVISPEYWISDLNKNLTNGRSHGHVVEYRQGSGRFC